MDAIIKVKQVPDAYAISTGLSKYNKSRMPHCRDQYQVAQGYDGRFQTGIDEEGAEVNFIQNEVTKAEKKAELLKLRLELERITGKKLDALSSFWETFVIDISTDDDLILNMANPMHVITHKALIANGLAAPDLASSGMPKYRNAKYYCFTEEKYEAEQVSTQKLRDKARGALLAMSNNDDKMLIMGQYLQGFIYKKGMKPDTLYSMLSAFINDVQNKDNVDKFIRASETSIEDLQYKITVDKAIKSKKIKFKDGQYFRGGTNLGKNLTEVLETLKSPEYANEFVAIHEEVN